MTITILVELAAIDWRNVTMAPLVLVAIVGTFLYYQVIDRRRIADEAESKEVDLRSIRWCFWPIGPCPFDLMERCIPGCRLYRVRGIVKNGVEKSGFVLIGPRRWVSRWQSYDTQAEEPYGTLTWRWQKPRHPKRPV